jgi:hypothetical protein
MDILDAFYHTCHDYPGGIEALAPRVGVQAGVLRNKACTTNTANKPTFAEALSVCEFTGDHRMVHAFADALGYVCVKVDQGVTAGDLAVLELVTKGLSAHGEVGAAVYSALADGRIERREMDAIEKAVYDTVRSMQELKARIASMAESN